MSFTEGARGRVSTVTKKHVLAAIAECDLIGRDVFLRKYGFGAAKKYLLIHDGQTYDSKAIYGVARHYAAGVHPCNGLYGGKNGAALYLQELGFCIG